MMSKMMNSKPEPPPMPAPSFRENVIDLPLLRRSWQRCWTNLVENSPRELANQEGIEAHRVFEQLCAKYSEPARKYHSLQHLSECLNHFERAQSLAARPAELEMALWFHDAIYELSRHDNEATSANWAEVELSRAGVSIESAGRVKALIMATRHSAAPVGKDECLLVDIDLSILGAQQERFDEYEGQIREEYSFVPEPVFKQKRKEILASFLARPKIYSTQYFFESLESSARFNLAQAISK
jgi:predicted metal-dependent HD superfamily phosphohydrolase